MADDQDTADPASNDTSNADGSAPATDPQPADGDPNADSGNGNATLDTPTPVSVSYDVELIPQPTEQCCWAASLAMVVSYRDHVSITVEDVAAKAAMDTATFYKWEDIRQAVSAWQLNEEGPVCALPDWWAQLLQNHGPLWIVEMFRPAHAVVLVGITGDGTPENTTVTLNNPFPTGTGAVQQGKAFVDFDQDFGLAASARAMIVHA